MIPTGLFPTTASLRTRITHAWQRLSALSPNRSSFGLLTSQRAERVDERDAADAERFELLLELELERARRHERHFSLTRSEFGDRADVAHGFIKRLDEIRISDVGIVNGGAATVLWSETSRDSALKAVRRLSIDLPGSTQLATRTVEYPNDGLSVVSLLEALDEGRGVRFDSMDTTMPAEPMTDDATPRKLRVETAVLNPQRRSRSRPARRRAPADTAE